MDDRGNGYETRQNSLLYCLFSHLALRRTKHNSSYPLRNYSSIVYVIMLFMVVDLPTQIVAHFFAFLNFTGLHNHSPPLL